MKKGFFLALGLSFSVYLLGQMAFTAELKGIQFYHSQDTSRLELSFDSPAVDASSFHVYDDKQIIVDLGNTSASAKTMRGFDTSEFAGSVVFINAYKKPGKDQDLRVAIQLRENIRSRLLKTKNKVILEIENRFGTLNIGNVNLEEAKPAIDSSNVSQAEGSVLVPKSYSVADILENLTQSGRKKYVGKRISINVKDVSVEDILKMIADASGFNIILTSSVKLLPPLTLNLTNIPWDQALDTILNLNKLVAHKNGIILMVKSLAEATEDKRKEVEADKLNEREEPLVTRIFPISYANTDDLRTILAEYITPGRGKISTDTRTNSLIVKDTPDTIERLKKIVGMLDTQTPQVMIESKIVEVVERYSREIGLQRGLNFGYDPIGAIGGRVPSVVGAGTTAGTNGGPGFSFSSAPSTGESRTLFGLQISRLNRVLDLNFSLQLMESESKAKIVASPKILTQNKKKATITTSDTKSYTETTTVNGVSTSSFREASASLNLDVTPQVTNEGSIVLEISIDKEQFGTRPSAEAPPEKQGRKIQTNVLVENGSTIVLGGVYSFEKRESHAGIPFLKDIPLIGWLFRTPHNPTTDKNELIIFLTPRVVNQEEAGLVDQG